MKYLTIIALILIIGIAISVILLAVLINIKPFDDHPSNHIEELQEIPEVDIFYKKYENYDIVVFEDGAFSYQIGFQAKNYEDQWVMLKLNYRIGILSNTLLHCTPDGIQSQYTIRDNTLEYLLENNCFEQDAEMESIDDFDQTWGGPRNRHPAFLGFDIPKICTEDMIRHLVKHSSMFDRNAPYVLEWISMDKSINKADFDKCVEELLEKNPKDVEIEN